MSKRKTDNLREQTGVNCNSGRHLKEVDTRMWYEKSQFFSTSVK